MRVLASLLLFAVSGVFAQALPPPIPPVPVASEFRTYGAGMPLSEFLRVTIGQVLGKPYVLSAAASQRTDTISADLSRVKASDLLPVVRAVLSASGLRLEVLPAGIYLVDVIPPASEAKAAEPPKEIRVYRPLHRPVQSFSSYLQLFPDVKLSYGQGLSVRASTPAPSAEPGGSLQLSNVSGASTFSQADGTPAELVAFGAKADLDRLFSLLAEVDRPVSAVQVRAYVYEVRTTDGNEDGVSIAASILGGRLSVKLGTASAGGDSLRISSGTSSLNALLGALRSDSRLTLVSSPVLVASDRSSASSVIGTETPTLGSIVTSANGQIQQSVSYQSSGVLLSVSPTIFEESIRLVISQELSSFAATDTGLKDTPTKLKRSFSSDIVAHSGDVLLLGGLTETSTTKANTRSLGIFGSRSSSFSSSELVVLLAVERI